MHALLKHPLVDCDLEEAALWYNLRGPDIAQRLINETEKAMRKAGADPFRFPISFGDYRRITIKGFPYALYFKVHENAVRVLAFVHGARDVELILQGRRSPED
jgi:plasmid stabilization system protein ParE